MCGVGEYLDYKSCKCRKSLVDKLVESSSAEECTENIDAEKIAGRFYLNIEMIAYVLAQLMLS